MEYVALILLAVICLGGFARREGTIRAQQRADVQAAREDRREARAQFATLERARLLVGHPLGPLGFLPPDARVSITTPPIRELAAPPVVPVVVEPPAPLVVPSTRALLDQGIIAVGRPLVQGWAAGGPLLGSPEQTFTAAIGGKSRSGKTRTMALIIGQMVLHGARLLVIDPHRHKADALTKLIAPLLPWCLLPPAFSLDEIKAVIERGEAEMTARRNGQHLDEPLLLVIDEYTLVQRAGAHVEWGPRQTLASRAAALVESVATEGGGMGMKGLIGGQNWKGTRAGGTEVRQMLQSAWVHRSWAEQARYLVPDADLADQAESLVPGRAIFVPSDDDPILVGMPLTEVADLERMAAMRKAASAPSGAPSRPFHVVPPSPVVEVAGEVIDAPPGSGNGKRQQVRVLVKQGVKSSAIIAEVWGVTGGRDYTQAANELTAILAELVP
jgi:hypothetical protein